MHLWVKKGHFQCINWHRLSMKSKTRLSGFVYDCVREILTKFEFDSATVWACGVQRHTICFTEVAIMATNVPLRFLEKFMERSHKELVRH